MRNSKSQQDFAPSCRLMALAVLAWLVVPASSALGDVFELTNKGSIRGQLLNTEEQPRKKYVVRTSRGAVVTLDRTQVKNVDRETPAELEYEKLLPTYPDTVEGQWELAEWCRENKLNTIRQKHLARVIELEPNHKQARGALGFIEFNGAWKTQNQIQEERGFVRYKGEWLLPQEIEIREKKTKDRSAEARWFKTLRQWRGWLGTERAAEAQTRIRSINDPYALKAISEQLQDERDQQVRLWYLDSLDKIPVPDALTLLVGISLHDPVEEVRLSALDLIVDKKSPEVPAMYINALRNANWQIVNRAAIALGKIKHPAAIGPLIDALVTTEKIEVAQGEPGGIGATFSKGPNGTGGGGLSVGASTQTFYRDHPNQDVLEALTKLTGQRFDFNVVAWKAWFANQKQPESIDGRRG